VRHRLRPLAQDPQNGLGRGRVPGPFGGVRHRLRPLAQDPQNGLGRGRVPGPFGGVRRTLCALALAVEFLAFNAEVAQIAEHGESNVLGIEEFARDIAHLLGGDGFDAFQHFVQSEEALEIEILAS